MDIVHQLFAHHGKDFQEGGLLLLGETVLHLVQHLTDVGVVDVVVIIIFLPLFCQKDYPSMKRHSL